MRARRTSGQDVLESRLAYTFSNRDFLVEALTHASAEATRAGEIVRHLREFVANGEVQSTFENPASLIKEALALGSIGTREAGIEMIVQHDPAVDLVLVDRVQTQQVLINLMVNAIQAMPEGGILTLAAEDWDEMEMPLGLKLSIGDSGPGIPPDEQARLFQPFYTAKKPGGTGLGLWVSLSLVERYGGQITLESAPGQGSRFIVWLRTEPLSMEIG